ncbi:uncharacterized protein N7515_002184 [Penicillium bovifimosum]|uniref:Uncharacterized protein n=1 Tax=Penicillium bovifimosum TaxID=126998 RepID=A0A9W9HB31_9EURO|nr:uncharacterized protein N7515_002184 [Penicillium bovifimosum]KAJ5143397.1 hypothetical protein N7515_002184 [Penicillium bovifimosum]
MMRPNSATLTPGRLGCFAGLCGKSLTMPRKRARTSPSPDKTRPPTPLHEQNEQNEQSATSSGYCYMKKLTPRERVDMILAYMREHHRWSIKDLIYHMVLAPSSKMNAHSETRRAKLVSQAIYGQPEVVKQLASVSKDIYTIGASDQVSRLQSELKELGRRNILGEFEPDADPAHMDIPNLATRAQAKAPELWGLLVSIMTPPKSSRDTSTVYQGSIFTILSILASAFAPRKSNNIPTLIGLYLLAMGVKRRVITFLAGLGINSAYQTIMDRQKELPDSKQLEMRLNKDIRSIFPPEIFAPMSHKMSHKISHTISFVHNSQNQPVSQT